MVRAERGVVTATKLVVLICVVASALALAGCKSSDEAITETASSDIGAGTVQAPLPGDTSTVTATSTPIATASVTPTSSANGIWPSKVGEFARAAKVPAWFPSTLPKGFKLEKLDVLELDTGTGLVCDVMWLNGQKPLFFTQGSPKERSYDIVSTEKVAWGDETASVVNQDPTDPSSPVIIVYSKDGNFAELQGDVTLDTLKAVAASMVRVR